MSALQAATGPSGGASVVEYWPRGAARELFLRRDPEILLYGPAGTGKTLACLMKLHLAAGKYPGMRALIVRKTNTALAGSAVVTYERKVLGSGVLNRYGVRYFGGSKRRPPQYEYPNGSVIVIGGIDNPDKILSAEFDLVYVNEATELAQEDWEMLSGRLRHGVMPYQQLIADCNPGSPRHWLKHRCDLGKTVALFSRHEDNPALYDERAGTWTEQGEDYLARLDTLTGVRYRRLRLGEWCADVEGALWNLDAIEERRLPAIPEGVALSRVVVAVDPPATADGAEAGIVVVALGSDRDLYVLDDRSRRGTPLEWATAAVAAYDDWEADAIVIEVNQGGDMAIETLRRVRSSLPVRPVRASRGKAVRAEPVSALYSQGRVHHVGSFPALEDQLASWVPGQASPDRLDALVWACTDLMGAAGQQVRAAPPAIAHASPWNAGGYDGRPF